MYTRSFLPSKNQERVAEIWRFPVFNAYSLYLAGNMSNKYQAYPGDAARNRMDFLAESGFGNYKIVRAIPQHGKTIAQVDSRSEGVAIPCDVLVTSDRKVVLTMCVGDCPAVIISTRTLDFVMLAHIGVEGAAHDIVGSLLSWIARSTIAVRPNQLLVGMGPAIHKCCYDAQWVVEKYGNAEEWKDFLRRDERDGKQHIDLPGYIEHQFLGWGVPRKNIWMARECTCCSRYPTGEFFLDSHHRAKTRGREGRFLVAAAIARQPWSFARMFGWSVEAVTAVRP